MSKLVADQALMELSVDVGPPVTVGEVSGWTRRCIPLLGGTVSGNYTGTILPGGADWQQILPDGTLEISAHYTLQLGQGAVEVQSDGLRSGPPEVLERLGKGESVPANEYYFRTAMRFFTAAEELRPLNRLLAIAVGERLPKQVRLLVYPVF